jgi:membrane protein implicated in regulation of membrane protease activity
VKDVLPWLLSIVTVTIMWLAGSKNPTAWVLGLAAQAGWIAFALLFEAWGLLPLSFVLIVVYARNLRRWLEPTTGTGSDVDIRQS